MPIVGRPTSPCPTKILELGLGLEQDFELHLKLKTGYSSCTRIWISIGLQVKLKNLYGTGASLSAGTVRLFGNKLCHTHMIGEF